jgi:hypothetical protein
MWRLVEWVAQFLEPDEREVVLGDLAEGREVGFRGLMDVLGLVLQRQAARLEWRAALVGAGLSFGGSLLLMGISVSLSLSGVEMLRSGVTPGGGASLAHVLTELVSQSVLLLGCAWSCGYFVAHCARRTLWASGFLCCLPCCFCFTRFCVEPLSPWSLFLFLVPAFAGARQALRGRVVRSGPALLLALVVTASMLLCWVNEGRHWNWVARVFDPLLIGPAWYLVTAARARALM